MPDAFKRVFATGPTGTLMLEVNGSVATHVPWPRQTCATTGRGGFTCLRLPAVKLWTPRHALPRVSDASVATLGRLVRPPFALSRWGRLGREGLPTRIELIMEGDISVPP